MCPLCMNGLGDVHVFVLSTVKTVRSTPAKYADACISSGISTVGKL